MPGELYTEKPGTSDPLDRTELELSKMPNRQWDDMGVGVCFFFLSITEHAQTWSVSRDLLGQFGFLEKF